MTYSRLKVRTALYRLALAASLPAALVLGCSPSSSGRSSAPARPPAEDFVLRDLEGRSVRLSDFEDQVRLINFWATWCGPCWLEVPHLQALHERYRDQGLAVIGISLDRDGMQQAVADFAREMELTYPVPPASAWHLGRLSGDCRRSHARSAASWVPSSKELRWPTRYRKP